MIPKVLTTCADPPVVPARPAPGQPRSDEDKANYTADLRGAYLDCKSTVKAIADRRTSLDAQAASEKPGLHIKLPHPFAKKAPAAPPSPNS